MVEKMNSSLQRLTEAPDKFSPPPRSSTLVQDDVMTQFNMQQVGVSEQDEQQSASSSLSGDGEDEDEKKETGDSKSSAASTGDRRHGDTLSGVDLVEDDLTKEKFRRLQHIFYKAHRRGKPGLDQRSFREAMRKAVGDRTDAEVDLLFMKVDARCEGVIRWEEYVSFMLMEIQGKDQLRWALNGNSLPRNMVDVAMLSRYQRHHDTIVQIAYLANKSETKDGLGRYVTVTREGMVNLWNANVNHIRTCSIASALGMKKRKKVWVTYLTCLPNVSMIAVSSTSLAITFYDISGSNNFRPVVAITHLETCASVMTYWTNPSGTSQLLWGDTRGNVSCVVLAGGALVTFLQPSLKKTNNEISRVSFSDILTGKVTDVTGYQMHGLMEDYVRRVKYVSALRSFIACCQSPVTSMYLGDIQGKKAYRFSVVNGINTFDYIQSSNMIITGGKDSILRVWNPYVTSAPVMILRGHNNPIVYIIANEMREEVLTISDEKEILIYSLITQMCVQSLSQKNIPLGRRPITGVYFNVKQQMLLMANNKLAFFQHPEEHLTKQIASCGSAVNVVLYNPLFHAVVCGDAGAKVTAFDATTGAKTIEFSVLVEREGGAREGGGAGAAPTWLDDSEAGVEITAMTFDPTLRRLLVATTDGAAYVWNFNSGSRLITLHSMDALEVTCVTWAKQRLLTAGWGQQIISYVDSSGGDLQPNQGQSQGHREHAKHQQGQQQQQESQETTGDSRQVWPRKHRDDILALAYLPPSTVVSSSYDGDVIVWAMETCLPVDKMNFTISAKPFTSSIQSLKSAGVQLTVAGDSNIRASFSRARIDMSLRGHEVSPTGKKYGGGGGGVFLRPPSAASSSPHKGAQLSATRSRDHLHGNGSPAVAGGGGGGGATVQKSRENLLQLPSQVSLISHPSNIDIFNEAFDIEAKLTAVGGASQVARGGGGKQARVAAGGRAIEKLLFLESRRVDRAVGNLVAAGPNGWLLFCSVHPEGGLLTLFNGAHKSGETVSALATDDKNRYLITGDTEGYVKVWEIVSYCGGTHETAKVPSTIGESNTSMVSFDRSMEDPFSARMLENQRLAPPHPFCTPTLVPTPSPPPIVVSFRGHLRGVTSVAYCNSKRLIISTGFDCSVRLWTIFGQFIGIFGQDTPWQEPVLQREEGLLSKLTSKRHRGSVTSSVNQELLDIKLRLPPDISRRASTCTMEVFLGGTLKKEIRREMNAADAAATKMTPPLKLKQTVNAQLGLGGGQPSLASPPLLSPLPAPSSPAHLSPSPQRPSPSPGVRDLLQVQIQGQQQGGRAATVEEVPKKLVKNLTASLIDIKASSEKPISSIDKRQPSKEFSKVGGVKGRTAAELVANRKTYKKMRKHQRLPTLPPIQKFDRQINIYHCLPLYDLDPVSTNVTLPKSLQDLDDFHVRLPSDRLMRSSRPAMSSGRRGSASLRAATQALPWGGAGGGLTEPQGSHSRRGSLRNIPSSQLLADSALSQPSRLHLAANSAKQIL